MTGELAYVADGSTGVLVLDVSNPADPQIVGDADTPGQARHVTLSGHHAYVADLDHGLQIIDITIGTDPQITGTADTPGQALGVAVAGGRAYVADYDQAWSTALGQTRRDTS